MPLIILTIIITFIILIAWTYHTLGNMEISKKILWIVLQLAVILIATFITYNISKNAVQYTNKEIMKYIQNTLVLLFTGINGLFIMPFFSRTVDAMNQEDVTGDQLLKKGFICIVLLFILLALECGYMANTQKGILQVMLAK